MSGVVRISEAVSLGIHAMVLIAANPGSRLSVKEIANAFQFSAAHLAKVMQRLVKEGLLSSVRGPAGGFELAKPSHEISLLDIYEALEGTLNNHGCLLGNNICFGGKCLLGDVINQVNDHVRQSLSDTNLAQLTRSYLLRANDHGESVAAD
jgi:Rrf2 family protein